MMRANTWPASGRSLGSTAPHSSATMSAHSWRVMEGLGNNTFPTAATTDASSSRDMAARRPLRLGCKRANCASHVARSCCRSDAASLALPAPATPDMATPAPVATAAAGCACDCGCDGGGPASLWPPPRRHRLPPPGGRLPPLAAPGVPEPAPPVKAGLPRTGLRQFRAASPLPAALRPAWRVVWLASALPAAAVPWRGEGARVGVRGAARGDALDASFPARRRSRLAKRKRPPLGPLSPPLAVVAVSVEPRRFLSFPEPVLLGVPHVERSMLTHALATAVHTNDG